VFKDLHDFYFESTEYSNEESNEVSFYSNIFKYFKYLSDLIGHIKNKYLYRYNIFMIEVTHSYYLLR
jgi:hypothetical protein